MNYEIDEWFVEKVLQKRILILNTDKYVEKQEIYTSLKVVL